MNADIVQELDIATREQLANHLAGIGIHAAVMQFDGDAYFDDAAVYPTAAAALGLAYDGDRSPVNAALTALYHEFEVEVVEGWEESTKVVTPLEREQGSYSVVTWQTATGYRGCISGTNHDGLVDESEDIDGNTREEIIAALLADEDV